jgi:myosin heavy chain 6/7
MTIKIQTLKRQLLEAEEVVTITMNKYRKAQQMLDDAERRAETAERNITVHIRPGRGRSMSVTRESTRIIRS